MRFTVLTALFAFLSTVSASPVHVEARGSNPEVDLAILKRSTGAHFSKRTGNDLNIFSPFLLENWHKLSQGRSLPTSATFHGTLAIYVGHHKPCTYTKETATEYLQHSLSVDDHVDVIAIEKSTCRIHYVQWLKRVEHVSDGESSITSSESEGESHAGTKRKKLNDCKVV